MNVYITSVLIMEQVFRMGGHTYVRFSEDTIARVKHISHHSWVRCGRTHPIPHERLIVELLDFSAQIDDPPPDVKELVRFCALTPRVTIMRKYGGLWTRLYSNTAVEVVSKNGRLYLGRERLPVEPEEVVVIVSYGSHELKPKPKEDDHDRRSSSRW